MIAAVLSLASDGFGLGFNSWAKLVVPVMILESLLEIVLINLMESWTSRSKSDEKQV